MDPLSALPVNTTSPRPQLPLEEPRFSIPPTRKRCFLHSHSRSEASAHGETAQIFMRADERCRISSGSALSFGDASRLTEFKRSVGGLKVAPLPEGDCNPSHYQRHSEVLKRQPKVTHWLNFKCFYPTTVTARAKIIT